MNSPIPTGNVVRFGAFDLDLRARELRKDGKSTGLREQSIRILALLLEKPGEVVLREEIRKMLWPNDTLVEFDQSINAAIKRLRQVLNDSAENPRYIETLARRGYRWMVPVEWVNATPARLGLPVVALPESQSFTANLIGKKVSHYRVLEILGGGGMGVVYKAEDLKLGRRVALKFLPEEVANVPMALKRFEREARAASALDHPNICAIYEFGEHEGQPFLVMQLLEGQTLRELLSAAGAEKAPLELNRLLELALQILDGLDAAHRQGIIHRDIKPANIFVTNQGQAKILDFGLAKLARTARLSEEDVEPDPQGDGGARETAPESVPPATSDPFLSRTGVAMGTAGYMSPEQVRGEKLDARTDLFSFGSALYEMATGKRAFTGDTRPVLQEAILEQVPIPVRKVNPELPARLEEIIHKALEKDRETRYQCSSEMRTDLQSLRREMEPRLAPPRWAGPHLSVAQRNWKLLTGILAVALTVIVTVGFGVERWRSHNRSFNLEKMEITKLTQSGNAGPVAISPDGRYVVYGLEGKQGTGLWLRQVETHSEVQIVPPEAVQYVGLSFSPDGNYVYFAHSAKKLTGFRCLYVMPALGGPVRLLASDVDSPAGFSPDGRQFAYTRGAPKRGVTELLLANADGSNNRLLATIPETYPGFQPGVSWSPDGSTLALSSQHVGKRLGFVLHLVSIRDGSVSEFYSSNYPIGRPLWLPDGNAMLVPLQDHTNRGQLWRVSYPQGVTSRLTNDLADYDVQIDATRNAGTVAVIQSRAASHVWVAPAADLSGGHQITFGEPPIIGLAAAAQGKIVTLSGDNEPLIMNADGSQPTPIPGAHNLSYPAACGRYFLFSSYQPGKTGLARADADGSNFTILVATGIVWSPICSPDLRSIFYVEGKAPYRIMGVPVEGGTPTEIATTLGTMINSGLVISPDGRSLAYAFQDYNPEPVSKLAIIPVDASSPSKVLEVPGWTYENACLRWSPDGKGLQSIVTRDGATNIWEQPLAGGKAKQLTKFMSGRIFDFDWSPDGRQLLLARGDVSRDVVLISKFR